MNSFSASLKQKAAGILTSKPTVAAPNPLAAAPNPSVVDAPNPLLVGSNPLMTAPAVPQPVVSSSSKFSMPSFSLPGITMPSLGLGIIPTGIDSTNNKNPPPTYHLYPSVIGSGNPDYTVPHETLLAAMHFPKTWNMAINKHPVILVPGTGAYGGSNFQNNFTKLLLNSGIADPMWLNIPGAMCDESPKNAEFVAYAIHYVWLVCGGKPVTLIAWSQGNLACQWTLKYWKHTRSLTRNLISISADFHGTLLAYAPIPNSPAILNQRYTSTFIRTLRANGGDSAYVPTTSIYSSAFDEVVQPQAGDRASAFIKDERNVGTLNVDLQQVCPLRPAGLIYGHAGVLYNGLAWALAKDAIINGGAAKLERIDLPAVSMQLMAPGLTIVDVNLTLGLIPVAGANIIKFLPKVFGERSMPLYAAADSNSLGPEPTLTPEQQKIVDESKNKPIFTQSTPVDPSLAATLPK